MPTFRVHLTRMRPGSDNQVVVEHGTREVEAASDVDARKSAAEGGDTEGDNGIEWTEGAAGFRMGNGYAVVRSIEVVGPKGGSSLASRQLERSPIARAPGGPVKMTPGDKPLKPDPEPDPAEYHDPNAPNNGIDGGQQSQAARDAKAAQTDQDGQGQGTETGDNAGEGTETSKNGKTSKKTS